MGKTREIACINYVREGECTIGRDGTFRKQCQICNKYSKKPGGIPARVDNRRKKIEKIRKKELDIKNY